MNSLADSGAIFNYHRGMIAEHGHEHCRALGWVDDYSQTVRFEAMARIADLHGNSVLDAGCGYGDLCAYLKNYNHYTGVEQIPELLDEAERRYGADNRVSFLPANFMHSKLPLSDYVIACGSLNYRSADPDFIFKAIDRLYQHCKLGLGFNLLRDIPGTGLIVAYDPKAIVAYCHTLTANVVLVDDYDPDDFTVFMYR